MEQHVQRREMGSVVRIQACSIILFLLLDENDDGHELLPVPPQDITPEKIEITGRLRLFNRINKGVNTFFIYLNTFIFNIVWVKG